MMVSTLVFLLASLLLSLTDARGLPQNCQRSFAGTNMNSFIRLNHSEEEARADRLYPRWRSRCVSAWELSNKLEGDLLLRNRVQMRQTFRDEDNKWPNRFIPYRIQEKYFTEEEVNKIHEAMKEFNKFTCVELREFEEGDIDYIDIIGGYNGCSSFIGRQGGPQIMTLEPPVCLVRRGTIFHEVMHALGFLHEHNSNIRDGYVDIVTANIAKGKEAEFDKYPYELVTDFGHDYDYDSIMHGGMRFLSGNNKSTILPKDESVSIGHKQVLSKIDIAKVNKHFGCLEADMDN